VRIPTTADVGGLGRIPTSRDIGRPDLTPIGEGMIAYGTAVGRAGQIIGRSISQMGAAFSKAANASGSSGMGGGGAAYDTRLGANELVWQQEQYMMDLFANLDPAGLEWRGAAERFNEQYDTAARAFFANVPEQHKVWADNFLFNHQQELYRKAFTEEQQLQGKWITSSVNTLTSTLIGRNIEDLKLMGTQDRIWDEYNGALQDMLDGGLITPRMFTELQRKGGEIFASAFEKASDPATLKRLLEQKQSAISTHGLVTSGATFQPRAYQAQDGAWRVGYGTDRISTASSADGMWRSIQVNIASLAISVDCGCRRRRITGRGRPLPALRRRRASTLALSTYPGGRCRRGGRGHARARSATISIFMKTTRGARGPLMLPLS
jgi:hypothetical protein